MRDFQFQIYFWKLFLQTGTIKFHITFKFYFSGYNFCFPWVASVAAKFMYSLLVYKKKDSKALQILKSNFELLSHYLLTKQT